MALLDLNLYDPNAQNLTAEQRKNATTMGLLSAAARLFDASAPKVGGVKVTPFQLLGSGLGGFTEGAAQYGQQAMQADQVAKQRRQQQAQAEWAQKMAPNLGDYGLSQDMATGMAPDALQDFVVKSLLERQKAKFGGNDPAALRLTNEYLKAVQSGDMDRANALRQFSKVDEKGVTIDASGAFAPMAGIAEALSSLAYGRQAGNEKAKTEYEPDRARQVAAETVIGKDIGETEAELSDRASTFPRLKQVVTKLSKLGKDATYTKAGQAVDITAKETGLGPTKGALARTDYIATVDNEVLPLLRQTFGAQFTKAEGESLRTTLGDPNKTPEEKDAVLVAFIQQKAGVINSQERKLGKKETNFGDLTSLLVKDGGPSAGIFINEPAPNEQQLGGDAQQVEPPPPTDADIKATALKYNITTDEVKQRLGLK